MDEEAQGPSAANTELANVQEDLRLVRNQVDLLQIAAADAKRPWWRQISTVISVVGLVLSATFSIMTTREQSKQRNMSDLQRHAEEQRRKLDLVNSSLTEIIAIRTEDTKEQATVATTNLAAYNAWNAAVNIKRMMLLETVVSIIREAPDDISPVAYLTLSNEMLSDGRYIEAEKYVKKGIEISDKNHERSTFLLGLLAQLYLLPGSPLYNPPLGREVYHRAIDSLPEPCEFNALNAKIRATLYWASQESMYGDPGKGQQLVNLARNTVVACSSLPRVAKDTLINQVSGLETEFSKRSLLDSSRWLGNWEIKENDTVIGSINFISGPGSPYPSFSKQDLSNGVLSQRQTGNVLVSSATTMRLEWLASWAVSGNGPYSPPGYSVVTLRSDGSLRGRDYRLGLPEQRWTAYRTPP